MQEQSPLDIPSPFFKRKLFITRTASSRQSGFLSEVDQLENDKVEGGVFVQSRKKNKPQVYFADFSRLSHFC